MTYLITKHARRIALGILLALAMQAAAGAALSSSQSGSSIPIVICTPTGMVILNMDLDPDTDDVPAYLKYNSPHCIFCAAHSAVPGLLVLAILFLLPTAIRLRYQKHQDSVHLPDAPDWLRAPVRAPPTGL